MAKKRTKNTRKTEEVLGADESAKEVSWLRSDLFVYAVLAILCLIIYGLTLGFDFVNLDDDLYVYDNPFVAKGFGVTGIGWAFTTFHAANWHPLTWISHQIDASLFGLEAGGHHAVNLTIHAANAILVFVVTKKLTGAFWRCVFVAAIFAVHPAHVESVAWISERKDVLSTLFWLLATLAYVRYAADTKNTKLYFASIVLFALGLMSKPMLVTLPFTLLLLDYWPLKRFETFSWASMWRLIREKLPFFALAAVSAVVTIFAQRAGGAIQSVETFSFADRILNAIVSYAKYVMMFFWPANLGVWYPFETGLSPLQILCSFALLITVTAVCIWQIRKREYLAVGWFWFIGTLVPVIGILQVGRQAMADRYTYVPYIGLSIAAVWLAADAVERFRLDKRVVAAVGVLILLAFTFLSFRQVSHWKNSETLYAHMLSITGKNYLVKNNLCNYLEKKNRLDEAATQCISAIADDPTLPDAYNTLGVVQLKQNKLDEAKLNFARAVELFPNNTRALANLAVTASNQGDMDAAAEYLNKAIKSDSGGFFDAARRQDAFFSLGAAAMKAKRYDRSAEFFQKSLEIAPGNIDAQRNFALSLHMLGRSAEGIKILEDAIRKNPNSAEVYNTLGLIYAEGNRKPEAIANFQKALQINPNFSQAQSNLKKVMQ